MADFLPVKVVNKKTGKEDKKKTKEIRVNNVTSKYAEKHPKTSKGMEKYHRKKGQTGRAVAEKSGKAAADKKKKK